MRKIIDKGLELSLIFLMAFLVVDVLWQVLSRYTHGTKQYLKNEY